MGGRNILRPYHISDSHLSASLFLITRKPDTLISHSLVFTLLQIFAWAPGVWFSIHRVITRRPAGECAALQLVDVAQNLGHGRILFGGDRLVDVDVLVE